MNYYRPTLQELEKGLHIQIYNNNYWENSTISNLSSALKKLWEVGDIRVKHLDNQDFESLGILVVAPFLREEEVIVGYEQKGLDEEVEVTEWHSVYDKDNLELHFNGSLIGYFYPNRMKKLKKGDEHFNVRLGGKNQLIKNLYELKKVWQK